MKKTKGSKLNMLAVISSSAAGIGSKVQPLRFTNNSESESSVSFSELSADIRYKLNGIGGYTQWDGSAITLQPGEYVEMVGDNQTPISESTWGSKHFNITNTLAASGSLMSLVSSSEIIKEIPQNKFFENLFVNCAGLTSAPELSATVLTEACYSNMFNGCVGLTSAPELPATVLAVNCYANMFVNCTGLTSTPELPAMVAVNGCYQSMFRGCTSLKSCKLLATEINQLAYNQLFVGCSMLSSIEVSFELWNTATGTYTNWVEGVAASGIFTCPAGLEEIRGVNNIPEGWTIVRQ